MPSCCLKSGVCAVLLEHPSGGGNGGDEVSEVLKTRRESLDYHSPPSQPIIMERKLRKGGWGMAVSLDHNHRECHHTEQGASPFRWAHGPNAPTPGFLRLGFGA